MLYLRLKGNGLPSYGLEYVVVCVQSNGVQFQFVINSGDWMVISYLSHWCCIHSRPLLVYSALEILVAWIMSLIYGQYRKLSTYTIPLGPHMYRSIIFSYYEYLQYIFFNYLFSELKVMFSYFYYVIPTCRLLERNPVLRRMFPIEMALYGCSFLSSSELNLKSHDDSGHLPRERLSPLGVHHNSRLPYEL
jgi:hypothetical protein